jgi:hypothetical protein
VNPVPRLLAVSKIKIKFADKGQRRNGMLEDPGKDIVIT